VRSIQGKPALNICRYPVLKNPVIFYPWWRTGDRTWAQIRTAEHRPTPVS